MKICPQKHALQMIRKCALPLCARPEKKRARDHHARRDQHPTARSRDLKSYLSLDQRLSALLAGGVLVFLGISIFLPSTEFASRQTVTVHPGDNIQELVESHPAGTSFGFSPGVYRLQSVVPRNGDSFIGEAGAVLSGAQLLNGFTAQGNTWVASVSVNRRAQYRGQCDQGHPACMYPEDLFIDNTPLERVADVSSVGPGKWYLDYDSGQASIGDNPQGHVVEISLTPYAFQGSAKNVTIQGLDIEKYADIAGDGAIQGGSSAGQSSEGWLVKKNAIRFNHGMGLRTGNSMQVISNTITDNGQMGLGGGGSGVLVEGNEIARNNYAGYAYGWEAGGSKFVMTRDLVVRNNYAHDNNGPGLWTDIDNVNTLYENNRTSSNKEAGILHEISHHAVIRNNTVANDGFGPSGKTAPWYGGGIVVTASDDVEVYGNIVTNCMNGVVGLQPDRKKSTGEAYLLKNLFVHDNTITQNQGVAAGILSSASVGLAVFTSWNNRFGNNTFKLADPSARAFAWMNAVLPIAQWQKQLRGN